MYCYNSVTEFLRQKLLQPSFIEKCEEWRTKVSSNGAFDDIFDGKVWLNPDGLSQPYNFALLA